MVDIALRSTRYDWDCRLQSHDPGFNSQGNDFVTIIPATFFEARLWWLRLWPQPCRRQHILRAILEGPNGVESGRNGIRLAWDQAAERSAPICHENVRLYSYREYYLKTLATIYTRYYNKELRILLETSMMVTFISCAANFGRY